MASINFALSGAMGRMGQMIANVAASSSDMTLVGGLEYAGSPYQGTACGAGTITSDVAQLSQAAVIIDFSRPEATLALVESVKSTGQALVIGTTGLDDGQEAILKQAAKSVPILYCANTSMGVNLLLKLVEKAAKALGDEWDIEIVETHQINNFLARRY